MDSLPPWAEIEAIFVRTTVRAAFSVLTALLLFGRCALSENASSALGEWAFAHEPEKAVLLVAEDGTALYEGQSCTWKDEGGILRLTGEEGESFPLRYLIESDRAYLYPVTVYEKTGEQDQSGLIGIWTETEGRGGSFVFTPAGNFLEDNTFSGTFTKDEEKGTFTLHYGGVFEDTLCYYSIGADGLLRVEYPWPVVPVS